jgi:O-antigen/teichoic acid export membrane protein
MSAIEGTSKTPLYRSIFVGTGGSIAPIRQLIRSSGAYALSSMALPLIALLLAPFLTHSLSPADYGILTILTICISLCAGITQLGLGSAFFRAYGYDYTSNEDRRFVIGTVLVLLCIVSLLMVVGAVLLAPFLANLLFNRPSLGNLIILTAVVVLLQNLTVPGFSWLRAENHAFFYSLLAIGNLLLVLITSIIMVGVLNMGLVGAILATGSGYASVMLITLPIIFRLAAFKIRPDIMRNLLSFGVPLVFSFLAAWILQVSDRYLLGVLTSLAETARYAVAYTLGSAISVVVIGPFTLAWPTAIFAIAKRNDAILVYKLVFRWFSIFLLFAAFGLSLVGTLLLDWLFPKTYHTGASIIPVVAVSIVFYGIYGVFMVGANIRRMTWLGIIFIAVAAFINVALNLVLIPKFGGMGAAISTLIAYIVLAAESFIVGRRIYFVPFETGIFLFALLLGVALYLGSYFAGRNLGMIGSWCISICAFIFYGVCLALLGIVVTKRNKE